MQDKRILVLNDQGGTVMHITHDMTEPLRANMKHHEPIILVYERHDQDARYKLLGEVSETVSAKYGTGGGNTPIVVEIGDESNGDRWQPSECGNGAKT